MKLSLDVAELNKKPQEISVSVCTGGSTDAAKRASMSKTQSIQN